MDSILNQSSAVCSKCGKAALYTVHGLCEECIPVYSVDYEVIGAYMYFTWENMFCRAPFGTTSDVNGVPLEKRFVCYPYMAEQAKEKARRDLAEFENKQCLIKAWSKYTSNNYYVAQADIDELIIYLGDKLAIEYIERKIDGDQISLKEFAEKKGMKGRLPSCLQ